MLSNSTLKKNIHVIQHPTHVSQSALLQLDFKCQATEASVSVWEANTTCCSCWSHFSCPTICRWKTTGARSRPKGSGSATLFTNGCRSELSCQNKDTETKLDRQHAAQDSTLGLGCWRASRNRWMQQMQAPSRAWNGCTQGMLLRPQTSAPQELALTQEN